MHKPQDELRKELGEAAQKVRVGGFYYHYKNPHESYKVLHVAITEWDDQMCVIYEAQYGERLIFVRPLSSWLDHVEWHGQTVPRFTFVT
jgi:hypothetical protein